MLNIKKIAAAIGAGALIVASFLPALAATEGIVTATVTPGVISVTLDTALIGYGTVGVPSVDNVPATPSADKIIGANNNGGIPENFDIKGANATPGVDGTKTWTIVDGAVGGATSYNYNHKFIDCADSSTCVSPAAVNNMTTVYETLATNVHPTTNDSRYFKLRLSTPTETGGDTTEHSTSVTVRATAY